MQERDEKDEIITKMWGGKKRTSTKVKSNFGLMKMIDRTKTCWVMGSLFLYLLHSHSAITAISHTHQLFLTVRVLAKLTLWRSLRLLVRLLLNGETLRQHLSCERPSIHVKPEARQSFEAVIKFKGTNTYLKLVTPWGWVVAVKIRGRTNTCQTRNTARLSKDGEVLGQTCNNEALRGQWWSKEPLNACINFSCQMDAVAIIIY